MSALSDFSGRIAFVTGAGTGIGAATATEVGGARRLGRAHGAARRVP